MSSESTPGGWWQPSWRRLVGSTVVLFVVILAFLVGRVRAGADPGLVREASQARQPQSAPPFSTPGQGQGSGSGAVPQQVPVDPNDPNDPFADPQSGQGGQGVDPGTGSNGTTDNFGNAIPDQSTGNGVDGSQGSQSLDPPSTHVS